MTSLWQDIQADLYTCIQVTIIFLSTLGGQLALLYHSDLNRAGV